MANGALKMSAATDGAGANDTGCGAPMAKPATKKATISTTFRMVATSWKVEECFTPLSCTSDTTHTTPTASMSGGASGRIDLPYSPNAIAASATGAAKPTVADTQPATKPKAGWKARPRKLYSPLERGNIAP